MIKPELYMERASIKKNSSYSISSIKGVQTLASSSTYAIQFLH